MKKLYALLCFTLLWFPGSLMAWGKDGHQLVCAVAEAKLTPAGRELVSDIMAYGRLEGDVGTDDGPLKFPDLCLWADEVRRTTWQGSYEMHYINVPRDAARLNLARDCAAMDCIVVGIQRSLVHLDRKPSGSRDEARRAAALRFLGHFIGDLHQPLHAGNREDRGGNDINVRWRGETVRLHALWDSHLPAAAGLHYPASVRELAEIAVDDKDTNVLNWMTESFNLGRAIAYRNVADRPILNGDEISHSYAMRAEPVIQQRILLAGHRLAWLLNELARGKLDTNILIN